MSNTIHFPHKTGILSWIQEFSNNVTKEQNIAFESKSNPNVHVVYILKVM